MIKIFFKTIWNNKRRNILVFIELFMISLILTNLTVYLVNILVIYRIKNCYDTRDVVIIKLSKNGKEGEKISEQAFINLKNKLASNPFVESVSFSNYANPYNYNSWWNQFEHDSVKIGLGIRYADIDYSKVMRIQPLKGRWFDESDFGKLARPILISKEVDEEYFHGNSIGARLKSQDQEYEIIGVTERFKRSDIESPERFAFFFKDSVNSRRFWEVTILIRTKEGKTADLLAVAENQVYSVINPDSWNISGLNSLENMHTEQNSDSYQRNYLTVIIAIFLMLNIFLGTIGILWYNTNLRFHEIGIRRAIGATAKSIRFQLISESMVMALGGLLIVIAIIVQTPVFFGNGKTENGVISISLLLSTFILLDLVLLGTWIPARLASKIQPAAVIKTE